MTTFPRSPRLLKGAIVSLGKLNPVASTIVFQYNPETMTRRVEPRTVGIDESDRTEALRLSGPPKESITLSVEIDATDQLESTNPLAVASGIYPALSALEMLAYPSSTSVIANLALSQLGNLEIIPPEAPMTLFVWGPQRVLPVRLTNYSFTEEAYDTLLNPIRAKADLSLQVLSYYDLKLTHPGHSIFMVHQIAKEALASANIANSSVELGTSLNLF